jgi:phospholipid/cholesterol/gamma-HCH transport system permease protein
MSKALRILGDWLQATGQSVLFLLAMLAAIPAALMRPRIIVQQLYSVGMLSMIIIVISASFVGMVLALQGYRTLSRFGAEESLGIFVALITVRELGPVLTALLYAGRAGSSLAAEIGLMRATDQLSAMEMMAVDPMQRVAAPRFVAGIIAVPLLAAIFAATAIGVTGGYGIGVALLGVDDGAYWSQIRAQVELYDLWQATIKALVFGLVVNWIAIYQGYHAEPTAAGVSRATTTTVVASSLAILGLNFIVTAVMFRGVGV